jgi:hypothetical protein
VVGWERCQSIEEIETRRMVVIRKWQWQYWQSCDRLKIGWKNGRKKLKKVGRVTLWRTRRRSYVRSGSGQVGVVSVDRGHQGGSNGTG